MTEAEWRSTDDWRAMLQFVKDKASPRKMRLFGVACCRRIAHLFHVQACHEALDVSEQYADGLASEAQRHLLASKVGALIEEVDDSYESERQLVSPSAYESALAVRAAIEEDDCLRSGGAI